MNQNTNQAGGQLQARAPAGSKTFHGEIGKIYRTSARGLSYRKMLELPDGTPVIETWQRGARGTVDGYIQQSEQFEYLGRESVKGFTNKIKGRMSQGEGQPDVIVYIHDSHIEDSDYESKRKTNQQAAPGGVVGGSVQALGSGTQTGSIADQIAELETRKAALKGKVRAELKESMEKVARLAALVDEDEAEAPELQTPKQTVG